MWCVECGLREAREGHDECFRCHIESVGFGFVGGGGYGRKTFSERTNAEFVNEMVPKGENIVPAERGCWT